LFTTPVIYLGFDRLGKLMRRNFGVGETKPEGAGP
jgi:argonaute-like protein implicated in RNA metabolism and viral defense